jgi:hypothetical protein
VTTKITNYKHLLIKNLGKGLFWRKQENAAKHGARLRGWQVTESDGDASQMIYVPNGTN